MFLPKSPSCLPGPNISRLKLLARTLKGHSMRKIRAASAAAAAILGISLVPATEASALGGEWLGCRVAPGTVFTFNQHCSNSANSATSFGVAFQVQNETAPSTYSWSVPAEFVSRISEGCTSTYNWCKVTVPNKDAVITVSVTLTQGGSSVTLTSTAEIMKTCYNGSSWGYC